MELLLEGLYSLRDYFIIRRIISLFIAFSLSGAIVVFMSKGAVLKYFGPNAFKPLSYLVAAFSGLILAVCSCSVLPMFASIRKKGAGIGPATAFLFSGPAINVLAILTTFALIGVDIGFARVLSAVVLSLVIGLAMFALFHRSEVTEADDQAFAAFSTDEPASRPMIINAAFFILLLGILISGPGNPIIAIPLVVILVLLLYQFFDLEEIRMWGLETYTLAKKIVPLFVIGIFLAGVISAALSEEFMASLVGSNTYLSNVTASTFGAFMYFATLTEVPIVEAFLSLGMHKGPAVALLIAGPSLSLPNMIVIGRVIGLKRALAYFTLVILLGGIAGLLSGFIIG